MSSMNAARLTVNPDVTVSLEARRLISRQRARDAAYARGHRMGLFRFAEHAAGQDESVCTSCGRSVFIDRYLAISGPALDEGCITEADRG